MLQPDLQLVDIDLGNGQDFLLNTTNDLASVSGNTSIIYGLIRRILVQRGTWPSDITFGSELYTLLNTKSVQSVTDMEISDIIHDDAAYRDWETDRKSTRLNSSHITRSRMPSSA